MFALQAISSPGSVPLKSLTLLGSSATSLSYSITFLARRLGALAEYRATIKTLYEAVNITNNLVDGSVSYPTPASAREGMKIEFQ